MPPAAWAVTPSTCSSRPQTEKAAPPAPTRPPGPGPLIEVPRQNPVGHEIRPSTNFHCLSSYDTLSPLSVQTTWGKKACKRLRIGISTGRVCLQARHAGADHLTPRPQRKSAPCPVDCPGPGQRPLHTQCRDRWLHDGPGQGVRRGASRTFSARTVRKLRRTQTTANRVDRLANK